MKNFTRLSLVLSVLFLFVTSHESNASIQSQQANQQTNFNNSYLPNYTVNTIDSEEAPVQLARKWGRNKSKHPCLRPNARSRMAKSRGFKSYCKKYKIKKAARARAHAKSRLNKRKAYRSKMRARMAQRGPQKGAPGKGGGFGCGKIGDPRKKVTCLRKKLDQTPLGKTVKKGARGIGMYGCGNPDKKVHIRCLRDKLRQQKGGKGRGWCGDLPDPKKKILCLRKKLDQTPLGKTVKKGRRGIGLYGCGNPDKKKHIGCLVAKLRKQNGEKGNGRGFGCVNPDRKKHVDCLRAKLDKTPLRKTVKMGPRGLGNYGCGNPDRQKHVSCLVAKLRQQKGGKGSKRPLCNIRKGFLNPKGLATRARECR
jgi:hypothetical protein